MAMVPPHCVPSALTQLHFISSHRSACSGAMKIEGASSIAVDGGQPPDVPESKDPLSSTSLAARPRRDVVHFRERLMGYSPANTTVTQGFIAFAHTTTTTVFSSSLLARTSSVRS